MGYQDGMGLRPGRTRDKLSADRGNTDSTFSSAAGYRAAGAVSPVREAPKSDAMATGGGALSQFSADAGPKVPKAPGLLQTVGGAAASHIGGKVLEKGVDKLGQTTAGRYVDHTMSGSSIPFSAMEAANASPDSIEYLDSRGYFDAPNNAPVVDASGLGEYAVPGIGADGYIDVMGDGVGMGADAAGSATDLAGSAGDIGFGDVAPYAGSAIRLAQGDVGGAAKAAAGTFIGNMILPGIGGFIGGAIGGGCFITEATMAGLGVQDDNAEPLKVLRFFRDQVLSKTPQGQAMIQEYEAIAPLVVEAVESRPDAMEIFKQLYEQFIAPAVEAIKAQNFPQALQIYAAMIAAVTPLAQEAMDAEDAMEGEMQQASEPQEGPQEAMQQMGDHAGMVAQNPQVAQQAAPQGALQQFNADEDYPSSVRFGRR
jgi:hypothetical protein